METDIGYPEYVDSARSVSSLRELLMGPKRDPWVQVGNPAGRVNLVNAGTIYKNTRL